MELLLGLLSICVLSQPASGVIIEDDSGIFILTEKNYKEAVKKHDYLIVEYYASWCGACKHFEAEFKEVERLLAEADSEVRVAKVDAIAQAELARKHDIKGYPTLRFVRHGIAVDYNGPRTAPEIVDWCNTNAKPAATFLTSIQEAKQFSVSNDVVVVGCFENAHTAEASKFTRLATQMDKTLFGAIYNSAVCQTLQLRPNQISIFKMFDEGRAEAKADLKLADLRKWVQAHSLRLVTEYSQEVQEDGLFGGDIKTLHFLAVEKTQPYFRSALAAFEKAAKKYRTKVIFVLLDAEQPGSKPLMNFLGLSLNDLPALRIINAKDSSKFKPNFITTKAVQRFTDQYLGGELLDFPISQAIPEQSDELVKILVNRNFNEIAFDLEKTVLIHFFESDNERCDKLEPIWKELAEHFKENDKVLIAKFNAELNDIEGIDTFTFPGIYLYPQKSVKPSRYRGAQTLPALIEFVEKELIEKMVLQEPVQPITAHHVQQEPITTKQDTDSKDKTEL